MRKGFKYNNKKLITLKNILKHKNYKFYVQKVIPIILLNSHTKNAIQVLIKDLKNQLRKKLFKTYQININQNFQILWIISKILQFKQLSTCVKIINAFAVKSIH